MALNHSSGPALGFDSASWHTQLPLAVLSDGANGTPHGGAIAAAVCDRILQQAQRERPYQSEDFQSISNALEAQWPDSGATLLLLQANEDSLEVYGVGDSYAEVFQFQKTKKSDKTDWHSVHQLARQVDAQAHPTQLIGADVPISPEHHRISVGPVASRWAAFFMSDGAGDFLSTADLRDQLLTIGDETPSEHDLLFCAESLAEMAVSRGSEDDTSVLMAWIDFKASPR
jgi:serine/threonine protein phosphatase PrpC